MNSSHYYYTTRRSNFKLRDKRLIRPSHIIKSNFHNLVNCIPFHLVSWREFLVPVHLLNLSLERVLMKGYASRLINCLFYEHHSGSLRTQRMYKDGDDLKTRAHLNLFRRILIVQKKSSHLIMTFSYLYPLL